MRSVQRAPSASLNSHEQIAILDREDSIQELSPMAEITAAAVKALREKTGLPMMECKQALQETNGDQEAAVKKLREKGAKTMEQRSGRETSSGRIAVHVEPGKSAAMVELQCESAPVAGSADFVQLADDLAKQLATGPGAATPEELFKQPSPSHKGKTLGDVKSDLTNRIREVFNLTRIARLEGQAAGYAHHTGTTGVLVKYSGDNAETARDIAMHVAAMRPKVLNKQDLDPADVDREREILSEASRREGKPENIIAKMVEGRMRNFFADCVLTEQLFVKDDKRTVGQVADAAKIKVERYVRWELGGK